MAYQTPWSKTQRAWLRRWAGKYIWWKTPREALQQPQRILAQVMALGEYSDAQTVVEVFGEDARDIAIHPLGCGVDLDPVAGREHHHFG